MKPMTRQEIVQRINEIEDEMNRRYEQVDLSDLQEEYDELQSLLDGQLPGQAQLALDRAHNESARD